TEAGGGAALGGGELLERGEQLEILERLLAEVDDDGAGRLLFLSGEAGVGKTALLRRFCAREGRNARPLWGSCERLFTPRPLGPSLDVAVRTGGELADLVAGEVRPHRLLPALARELARARPTVLVLEDLHWADEGTLDVLRLVGARIDEFPALVLGSYRD